MITGAGKWHNAAFLPVRVVGNPHLFIEVTLAMERGRVGVALQRADETIVEQLPLPDHWGSNTVRFFAEHPQDCHSLLFRNWGDSDQPAQFSIEEVRVHRAFRELTRAQFDDLGPEDWVHLKRPWLSYLEFHLLDYCNLSCPFCSHGTSGSSRGYKYTSLAKIRHYSRFFEPYEFESLKVAGGEPSLHPQFSHICRELRGLYPTLRCDLASNGARLLQYLEEISIFDWIDLSNYPGRNDEVFNHLLGLGLPNIFYFTKSDGCELFDSNLEPNQGKLHLFENCHASATKMIANGRIYDCPVLYGQLIPPKNLSMAESSVPMDEDWRPRLAALEIEHLCKRCFNPIDAPRVVDDSLVQERWQVPKRIGYRIYDRQGRVHDTITLAGPVGARQRQQGLFWTPPIKQPHENLYIGFDARADNAPAWPSCMALKT